MKLKKCILAKVLAATMLCESLFGFALTMPTPVYAAEEDGSVDNTGEEDYPNVAEGSRMLPDLMQSTVRTIRNGSALICVRSLLSGCRSIWEKREQRSAGLK